jgi:hypothetical protein
MRYDNDRAAILAGGALHRSQEIRIGNPRLGRSPSCCDRINNNNPSTRYRLALNPSAKLFERLGTAAITCLKRRRNSLTARVSKMTGPP